VRRSVIWLSLVILIAVLIVGSAPWWVSWAGIPREVKVFPGTEFSLEIRSPFRLYDAQGGDVTGSKGRFSFVTDQLGTAKYQVSLFGWIPITEMVVDVVPLIRVFPGGQSIGVLVTSDGLIVNQIAAVVDLDGAEHFPARDAGIQPGDVIVSIQGNDVRRPEQVSELVNRLAHTNEILEVVIRRSNRTFSRKIQPIRSERTDVFGNISIGYLLGVYLEDPAAGVGTLSFYDPVSGRYGALGHTIVDSLGRAIKITGGSIVEASIDSVRYGLKGAPGEKLGFFHGEQDVLGTIDANSGFGIFGKLSRIPTHPFFKEPLPVAFAHQVQIGPAEIYTVLSGNRIEKFQVEIIRVSTQTRPSDKGIVVQISDSRLLQETGGIIQGMSGSPIIQNGMLVGAVTHVFVNDPTKGYGSFAEWMIYEAGLPTDLPANNEFRRKVFFCM
jgi:stage IV sporulation protein B